MKRLIKLMMFVAAFIVTGSVTIQAKAENENYKYGDFTYKVENDEITITDYSNEQAKDIVIPNTIEGKRVVAVEKNAFFLAYSATSLTCSDYMKNVSMESFVGMYNLKTITLGKYTKKFSAKGDAYNCGVSGDPFHITKIILPTGAKYLKLIDGVLYSKDGKTLYYRPNGIKDTSYTVASGTTTIAPYAFYFNRNLKKVVLSKSVKKIGSGAFAYSGITSIHLSSNLTTIGSNAFNNCKSLKSIIVRKKVTTIGRNAFYKCINLKAIRIQSEMLSQVGSNAFGKTKALTTIKVPSKKLKNYKNLLAGKGQSRSVRIIAYN